MEIDDDVKREIEMLSKLPKLRSKFNRDANGKVQSISVHATDEPLYSEQELKMLAVPKWLRRQAD